MSSFDSSDEENQDFTKEPLKIDWVDLHKHGLGDDVILGISALPGCRYKDTWRDIKADLKTISEQGVRDVFVLCTRGELTKYRTRDLFTLYEQNDIVVHHHPILDGQTSTVKQLNGIVEELKNVLKQDRKTLVHCFGGLGRSCLVVALLLMCLDKSLNADEAIGKMRQLRGKGAIQSVKQYNMLMEFRAKAAASNASDSGEADTNNDQNQDRNLTNGDTKEDKDLHESQGVLPKVDVLDNGDDGVTNGDVANAISS